MLQEINTLREKRKHNNILELNKNYTVEFSFTYSLFILGKNKKTIY